MVMAVQRGALLDAVGGLKTHVAIVARTWVICIGTIRTGIIYARVVSIVVIRCRAAPSRRYRRSIPFLRGGTRAGWLRST